jgi:hypothetical protein
MSEQYFFYREKGDLKRIDINDIILFESDKNYVHFLKESEIIIVRTTFENALRLLSPYHFIQVNRAKAISLRYLYYVSKKEVIIKFQPVNNLYRKLKLQLVKQREIELSKLESTDLYNDNSKNPASDGAKKISKESANESVKEPGKETVKVVPKEAPEIPSLEELEKIIKVMHLSLELAKSCYKPLIEKLTIIENPKGYVEEIEITENGTEIN